MQSYKNQIYTEMKGKTKKQIKEEEISEEESEEEQYEVNDISQYDLCVRWVCSEVQNEETLKHLQDIICEGLGERISSINIITDLSMFPSLKVDNNDVIILLKYSEPLCYKQVLLGPPSNNAEEAEVCNE